MGELKPSIIMRSGMFYVDGIEKGFSNRKAADEAAGRNQPSPGGDISIDDLKHDKEKGDKEEKTEDEPVAVAPEGMVWNDKVITPDPDGMVWNDSDDPVPEGMFWNDAVKKMQPLPDGMVWNDGVIRQPANKEEAEKAGMVWND